MLSTQNKLLGVVDYTKDAEETRRREITAHFNDIFKPMYDIRRTIQVFADTIRA